MGTWAEDNAKWNAQGQGSKQGGITAMFGGDQKEQRGIAMEVMQGIVDDVGLSIRSIPHLPSALVGGWWDSSIPEDEKRLRRRSVADAAVMLASVGLGKVAATLVRGGGVPLVRALFGTGLRAGATIGGIENTVFEMIDQQNANPGSSFARGAVFGGALGWAGSKIFKGKGHLPVNDAALAPEITPLGKGLHPGDDTAFDVFKATLNDPDDPFHHFLWNSLPEDQRSRVLRHANDTVVSRMVGDPETGASSAALTKIAEQAELAGGGSPSLVKPVERKARGSLRNQFFRELSNHTGLKGAENREARLDLISNIIGRKVTTLNELADAEVKTVTARLASMRGASVPESGPINRMLLARDFLHGREAKPSLIEFPDQLHRDLYTLPLAKEVDPQHIMSIAQRLNVQPEDVLTHAQMYRDVVQWEAAKGGPGGIYKLARYEDAVELLPDYIKDSRNRLQQDLTRRTAPAATAGDAAQGVLLRRESAAGARARRTLPAETVVPDGAEGIAPIRLAKAGGPSLVRYPDKSLGVMHKGNIFKEGDRVKTFTRAGNTTEGTLLGFEQGPNGRILATIQADDGSQFKKMFENVSMVGAVRRNVPTERMIKAEARAARGARGPAGGGRTVTKGGPTVEDPRVLKRRIAQLLQKKVWSTIPGVHSGRADEFMGVLQKANREGDAGKLAEGIGDVLFSDVGPGKNPIRELGQDQVNTRNALAAQMDQLLRTGFGFEEQELPRLSGKSRAPKPKPIAYKLGKGKPKPKGAERQANRLLRKVGFFQQAPSGPAPQTRLGAAGASGGPVVVPAPDDVGLPNPMNLMLDKKAAEDVAERFIKRGVNARVFEASAGRGWGVVALDDKGNAMWNVTGKRGQATVTQAPSGSKIVRYSGPERRNEASITHPRTEDEITRLGPTETLGPSEYTSVGDKTRVREGTQNIKPILGVRDTKTGEILLDHSASAHRQMFPKLSVLNMDAGELDRMLSSGELEFGALRHGNIWAPYEGIQNKDIVKAITGAAAGGKSLSGAEQMMVSSYIKALKAGDTGRIEIAEKALKESGINIEAIRQRVIKEKRS